MTTIQQKHPFRKTLLLRILPAALALALLGTGFRAWERYASRQTAWEERLETLTAERDAALAEFSEADPSGPEYAGRWERLTGDVLADAEAEAASLEAELWETEESIRSAEEEMGRWRADEEYVYVRAVCDALEKGRAYVEELLSKG